MENTTDIPYNTTDIPHEDVSDKNHSYIVGLICYLSLLTFFICNHSMETRSCCMLRNCIRRKPRRNRQTIDHNTIIYNNMLTNTYIQKLNENNNTNNYSDCSVCIEKIDEDIIRLDCGHNFHINCIQGWVQINIENRINPLCPLCREKIIQYV